MNKPYISKNTKEVNKKYRVKKKIIHQLLIYAVLLLFIFVIAILNGVIKFGQNFDSKKDVCIRYEDAYFNKKMLATENEFHNYKLTRNICTLWRPKNRCELDPNAENCVCEVKNILHPQLIEHIENKTDKIYCQKEGICILVQYDESVMGIPEISGFPIIKNTSIQDYESVYNCTRAHEAN